MTNMKKLNNSEIGGVLRIRHCRECALSTQQEIVFENNNLVAYCLECGNEIILAKDEIDG